MFYRSLKNKTKIKLCQCFSIFAFVTICLFPEKLVLQTDIQNIIAGPDCSGFITTQSQLYCCGDNKFNRLGLNEKKGFLSTLGKHKSKDSESSTDIRSTPTAVKVKTVKSVSFANNHTCVLQEGGSLLTFGNDDYGQLGNFNENQGGPYLVKLDILLPGEKIDQAIATDLSTAIVTSKSRLIHWGSRPVVIKQKPSSSVSFMSETDVSEADDLFETDDQNTFNSLSLDLSKQTTLGKIKPDDIFSESGEDEFMSLIRGTDADDDSIPTSRVTSPTLPKRRMVKFKPVVAISIVEEGEESVDNDSANTNKPNKNLTSDSYTGGFTAKLKEIVPHHKLNNYFLTIETSLTSYRDFSVMSSDENSNYSDDEFPNTVKNDMNTTEIPGWLKAELDHGQVIRKTSVKRNKRESAKSGPKVKIVNPPTEDKTKNAKGGKYNNGNIKKTQSYAELQGGVQRREMEQMKNKMHVMALELENYRRSEDQFTNMKSELQDQKQQNQMMHDLLQHFMKSQNEEEVSKSQESGIKEKKSNPSGFSKKFGSFRRKSGNTDSSGRRTSRDTGDGEDDFSVDGSMAGSKLCVIQ